MRGNEALDVAVVGGGVAGLTAAILLARAGRRVRLFEKAREVGGRAVTRRKDGFCLNIGPHALYLGGAGIRVLRELAIPFDGRRVTAGNTLALVGGRNYPLPAGPLSFLSTGLMPGGGKLELARVLWRLRGLDVGRIAGVPMRRWLDENVHHPETRALMETLIRVANYAADMERASAGAALDQLRRALAGVLYLDHGWQVLVDGLREAAVASGVGIQPGARVTAVERSERGCVVRLGEEALPASQVVIAGSPHDAASLLGSQAPSIERFAREALPVRAACLDVALSRLPRPDVKVALGMDRPLYFSVHSASAKLAPEGGALIHVARYLGTGETPEDAEAELEGLMDRLQPGWREAVVERRFLPHLIVTHALVEARTGGMAGRPEPRVPELPDVYLAGDWVGPTGMLADASFASAKLAAGLIMAAAPIQAAVAAG